VLDGPIFTSPLDPDIAGDDPLGLAPVNERLYNAVFPGINNFVRYIRVYSSLCWMVDRVEQYFSSADSDLSKSEATKIARHAYEKIQLVLVWVNQAKNYPQVAGSRRAFPGDNRKIELSFDNFGDSSANLLSAVAYGPSLTNGLGFLERRSNNTFACTPAGKTLANAFDEHARTFRHYKWLADVTNLEATRSKVFELEDLFDLGSATDSEQQAFLRQFFPANTSGLDQLGQNRWLAIHLALRATEAIAKSAAGKSAHGFASADQIRACMAWGQAPGGKKYDIHGVNTVQVWWAILQLRQLHRLAIDTLFAVTETWLADESELEGDNSLDGIANVIGRSCAPRLDKAFQPQVSRLQSHFREVQGTNPSLSTLASQGDEYAEANLFEWIDDLWDVDYSFDDDGGNEAVHLAYLTLIFCASEAANFLTDPHTKTALASADSGPCSLVSLARIAERFSSSKPSDFVSYIVKNWVLLRHFQVVSDRSQVGDGKNRFRFVVGDRGLERFNPAAGIGTPAFAQDRLNHILVLCCQCGLLEQQDETYRLTRHGHSRLHESA
jgi:hypothetical protein